MNRATTSMVAAMVACAALPASAHEPGERPARPASDGAVAQLERRVEHLERSLERLERAVARLEASRSQGGGMMGGGMMGGGIMGGSRPNEQWRPPER